MEEDVSNYVLHGEMELFGTPFNFAGEVSRPVVIGDNICLTINPSDVKTAKEMFDELKENGEIPLPPTETFYSPLHAAVNDRYGIVWNIIVNQGWIKGWLERKQNNQAMIVLHSFYFSDNFVE